MQDAGSLRVGDHSPRDARDASRNGILRPFYEKPLLGHNRWSLAETTSKVEAFARLGGLFTDAP
jgi:hypothetical protein